LASTSVSQFPNISKTIPRELVEVMANGYENESKGFVGKSIHY
jgi:hypothetical protein